MNTIIRGLWLLFLLAALPFARAQEKAPDPQAEYDKLTADFASALDEYYRPYSEAKSDADKEKIELDPAKDPRKTFIPKFVELGLRAQGTEAACRSWVWVFENADESEKDQRMAFDRLCSVYVTSPSLEGFVRQLAYPGPVGDHSVDLMLEKILLASPHDGVRAAVLISQVRRILGSKPDQATLLTARAKLERVQKEFGKTGYAAQAAGMIFEADHLQIGMQAPDFDALDQDGKPWKLSDYRGKVVVVDFWGYW